MDRNGRSLAGLGCHWSRWGLVVAVCLLIPLCGCVGMLANIMHAAHGNLQSAKYNGLRKKRVAVVCVSNSEAFGPTAASVHVARQVGQLLESKVDDLTLVDPQKIADWVDRHDWDQVNFPQLGRAVGAEMVVAIDLDSFSLHDGKTLYRGRADVKTIVYDMEQNGKPVFTFEPSQIMYPENAGYHTTDLSEDAFRRQFINVLATRIARQFYAYDLQEDFARDTSVIRSL